MVLSTRRIVPALTRRSDGVRYPFYIILLSLLTMLLAACGGEDENGKPTVDSAAVIVSSDLAVGPNRFMLGLADRAKGSLIVDAQLHFRFFKLATTGADHTLKAEMDARPLTVEKTFTHVHDDGPLETHKAGTMGVYLADVSFDSAGNWGVEVTGRHTGQPLPAVTSAFAVREQPASVAVGQPAPRTEQRTLRDVKDISEVDTGNPPDPHMHDMTIADAVTSGKPTVIVFSTPGFCLSQTCGPVKELVDRLYERFKGRANFIHVEPYELEKARSGRGLIPVPALAEWGLLSEPWTFMGGQPG